VPIAAIKDLPFLNACITETLRMYNPSAAYFPKMAPKEGDILPDGRKIPGNTRVFVNTWAISRDPAIFGSDADGFRPERWLSGPDETVTATVKSKEMRRAADLVFGAGQFTCLGKTLAYCVMRKLVFELVKRYDVQIVDAANPWKVWNMHLMFVEDFNVTIQARADTDRARLRE
jgi:cytochrome P450